MKNLLKPCLTVLTFFASFLVTTTVFADPAIELDALDYKHCIQQLSSIQREDFEVPVVLLYETGCPYADIFLPTYNQVAASASQAGRAFFRFDFSNPQSKEAARKCLGYSNDDVALVSPSLTVIAQLTLSETEIVRSAPLRTWGGTKADPYNPTKAISITPAELEHIIDLNWEAKLIRAKLEKSLSHKVIRG